MTLPKSNKRRKLSWKHRLFRRYVHSFHARDLLVDLQRHAKAETFDYILAHMRHCMLFEHRFDLLGHVLQKIEVEGLYLEFGVADGASITETASLTSQPLHGFDSFEGLPEDWAGTSNLKGKFSRGGKLPPVPASVTLHKGWFDAVLPEFFAQHPEKIAFIHLDCDLYSSSKCVFECVADRLQPGTVILFDEYFNYPNWQEHEFRAFQEFVAESGIQYEYLGYTVRGQQAAIRIK